MSARYLGLVVAAASGIAVTGVAIVACNFESPNYDLENQVPVDAVALFDSPIDAFIVDAGPCQSLVSTCVGNGERLRACTAIDTPPVETVCPWACSEVGTPHCNLIKPSGGAVTPADVDPLSATAAGLMIKTLAASGAGTIDTETGRIQVGGTELRPTGTGIKNGIDFQVRGKVGVFRFQQLTVEGPEKFVVDGANALALVALTSIEFKTGAELDLRGDCAGRTAGPGGNQGGNGNGNGAGAGAGGGGAQVGNNCSGGGGAGFGENGGNGGLSIVANRGTAAGTVTLDALVGGAGGGGGGANGGEGGGGGGAVQLVANMSIRFAGTAAQTIVIDVSGCSGRAGACGGGGGAGGAILVEAATIDLVYANLAANGGGAGGAGAGATSGQNGSATAQANGGAGGTGNPKGGNGGKGGRGDKTTDGDGPQSGGVVDGHGGGGGGAGGRIRLNTKSGTVGQATSVISPSNDEVAGTFGTARFNSGFDRGASHQACRSVSSDLGSICGDRPTRP